MKELFGIPALEETRLWVNYTSKTYEQLTRLDNTVQVSQSVQSDHGNSISLISGRRIVHQSADQYREEE